MASWSSGPIGHDAFVHAPGAATAEGEAQLLTRILQLPTSQHAWLLLLFCAVPRANHVLRTAAPAQVEGYAAAHDAAIMRTFD